MIKHEKKHWSDPLPIVSVAQAMEGFVPREHCVCDDWADMERVDACISFAIAFSCNGMMRFNSCTKTVALNCPPG